MSTQLKPAHTTPTSNEGDSLPPVDPLQAAAARQQFLAAAVSMSWQLAIVVLVPVLGGFKLDEHFKTSPLLTVIGLVLALIGMSLIVWRQLRVLTPKTLPYTHPTPPENEDE